MPAPSIDPCRPHAVIFLAQANDTQHFSSQSNCGEGTRCPLPAIFFGPHRPAGRRAGLHSPCRCASFLTSRCIGRLGGPRQCLQVLYAMHSLGQDRRSQTHSFLIEPPLPCCNRGLIQYTIDRNGEKALHPTDRRRSQYAVLLYHRQPLNGPYRVAAHG